MADEQKTQLRLEIAHVLFIDIVGYSKLLIDEQSEALQELNQIVRKTEAAARSAKRPGKLIILPTGDGMALVFTGSVGRSGRMRATDQSGVAGATEFAGADGHSQRSGASRGRCEPAENIAGAGINIAQRVMDCGDAGHILVSKRVADDLAQYRRWQPYLHELGDVEVKHGVVVSVVNLYSDVVGNPNPPDRFKQARSTAQRGAPPSPRKRSPLLQVLVVVGLMLFCLAVLGIIFAPAILKQTQARKTTAETSTVFATPSTIPIPEKSIAVLPFENFSESKENDFFADGVQDDILTALARVRT